MAVLGNEEHKQRINLSSFAQSVIEADRSVFDEQGSRSGFFNRIISGFREQANASIDVALARRRESLLESGHEEALVRALIEQYRQQLQQKIRAYPQGDSVTFRLNNENFRLLYEDRIESGNYASPAKYLKALFEEYATLSPSQREQVYFRALLDTLNTAIDAGYLLLVQLGQREFRVRPYKIMADPYNSHLYLTGLSRSGDDTREVIASFRITRMQNVRIRRQKGRLTADDRRDIEEKLRKTGVQYLIGDVDQIRLQLTPTGRQAFLQRSYMRPTPDKVEKDIYHFSCTPMQIRNYFLSFGKEVRILEPDALRQEFIETYRQALESYQ